MEQSGEEAEADGFVGKLTRRTRSGARLWSAEIKGRAVFETMKPDARVCDVARRYGVKAQHSDYPGVVRPFAGCHHTSLRRCGRRDDAPWTGQGRRVRQAAYAIPTQGFGAAAARKHMIRACQKECVSWFL